MKSVTPAKRRRKIQRNYIGKQKKVSNLNDGEMKH